MVLSYFKILCVCVPSLTSRERQQQHKRRKNETDVIAKKWTLFLRVCLSAAFAKIRKIHSFLFAADFLVFGLLIRVDEVIPTAATTDDDVNTKPNEVSTEGCGPRGYDRTVACYYQAPNLYPAAILGSLTAACNGFSTRLCCWRGSSF